MSAHHPSAKELRLAAEALQACALRFDGYRYVEVVLQCGLEMTEWLTAKVEDCRLTESLPDGEEAFVLLFLLHAERRESGWFTSQDAGTILGARLYLKLYNKSTPLRWCWDPHSAKWDIFPSRQKREAAAILRRWLEQHKDSPPDTPNPSNGLTRTGR